jgi:LPXTG-motif cell wall-anchored protein
VCADTKVDVSINGLPGKISAGSGWHKFSLNVLNNSDSTLNDLDFFAGASPDKNGEELFSSKQVQLQAWDPQDKIWVDLNEGGYAVGYVGYTDELKPDYEFQIVSAGTDTGGTKPQEGGKAPVTDKKPTGTTPEVTGSLAETGSSSALPMISLVGGAAVVAGAGAIFVVRRRKAGVEA